MTPSARAALNRRLWASVRTLPGGEQTLRDLVGLLRQEDRSGAELAGTVEYTSTKRLTDRQFEELLSRVEAKSKRPPRRRRPVEGNVVFLAGAKERSYITFLSRSLGWTNATLQAFVERQTGGRGVKTHSDASAVIEPMERMLHERGFKFHEEKGKKWWEPPATTAEAQG